MAWVLEWVPDRERDAGAYVLLIGAETFRRGVTARELVADPDNTWVKVAACWRHADGLLYDARRERENATPLSFPWMDEAATAKEAEARKVQRGALALIFPDARDALLAQEIVSA